MSSHHLAHKDIMQAFRDPDLDPALLLTSRYHDSAFFRRGDLLIARPAVAHDLGRHHIIPLERLIVLPRLLKLVLDDKLHPMPLLPCAKESMERVPRHLFRRVPAAAVLEEVLDADMGA